MMKGYHHQFIQEVLIIRFDREFFEVNSPYPRNAESIEDLLGQFEDQDVAFDFSNVEYLDSTGAGVLFSLLQTVNDLGGEHVVFGCGIQCSELLTILRADRLTSIVGSEQDCFALLNGTAEPIA